MYLENLRVSGFKAIQDLEFSPKSINIITGPNNSGKTSFLESVDLLFNPSSIKKWEQDIDYLINAQSKNAAISCEYSRRQTTLADFMDTDDDGSGAETRELAIRPPRETEALDSFVNVIYNLADSGPNTNYYTDRLFGQQFDITNMVFDIDEKEFDEIISTSLRDSIITACEDTNIEDIRESSVVLSLNGEEYPYVYLDDDIYNQLRDEIAIMAARRAVTRISQRHENVREGELEGNLDQFRQLFSDLLIPRLGRDRFVRDKPPSKGEVVIGNTETLSASNVNLSRNQGAVRLNKIEDHIRDAKILRNLEDLSLDNIVFENDDGEYQVPYDFMGEGFKQIMTILWELYNQDISRSVLLLEEAENHMHPGYISKLVYALIDVAMKNEVQMFITTHNIDFIDSFFSPNLSKEEEEFLEDQFSLLKMGDRYTEQLNYSQSENDIESIHTDLRGL